MNKIKIVAINIIGNKAKIIESDSPLTIGELTSIKQTVDEALAERIKIVSDELLNFNEEDYLGDENKE